MLISTWACTYRLIIIQTHVAVATAADDDDILDVVDEVVVVFVA